MGIVAAGSNGTVSGTVPKFATHYNFAMITKFRYDSEITVCEIFCFCFFYPNDFIFGFSHFYPHCNYSSLVILVFHMFVRLYKPL